MESVKYGVFLVCIFPYSVQMRENTEQKNSIFGQFLRRASCKKLFISKSLPERFKYNRPSRAAPVYIRVINEMEIVHEILSFQSIIYCTDKSRVTSSVYGQA